MAQQGPLHGGSQPHHQIDTDLHHRARMEQSRHGSRGDHGPKEPALKRKLCGLGECGQREQSQSQQGKPLAGTGADDLLQVEGAHSVVDDDHGDHERHAAKGVHPEGPDSIADGVRRAVMPDEEERAERRALKEEMKDGEVVGKHHAVHDAQECQHDEEKPGLARPHQLLVRFMVLHVWDGLKADDGSHDGDDQDHDQCQMVAVDGLGGGDALDLKKLEPGYQDDLQARQADDRLASLPAAEDEDGKHEHEVRDLDELMQSGPEDHARREGEGHMGGEQQRGQNQCEARGQYDP